MLITTTLIMAAKETSIFVNYYFWCVLIPKNIQKLLGFAPSRAASKVGGLLAPPQGTK